MILRNEHGTEQAHHVQHRTKSLPGLMPFLSKKQITDKVIMMIKNSGWDLHKSSDFHESTRFVQERDSIF